MSAAPLRRLVGLVIVTFALTVVRAPARAEQCGNSCASGRGVCAMQTHTARAACLKGCAAGDAQCHAACLTAMRTARAACQSSRTDCMTNCPGVPAGTAAACVDGCGATLKQCFTDAFTAGTTCVRGCKAAGSAGLMSCLVQCAATMGSSRAACIAAFQGCLRDCPVPTPPAQCSSVPCGGPCVIGPTCPPGGPCPEFASRLGQCEADSTGTCGCVPASPPPTRTALPTPTPQCSDAAACGGPCIIGIPFPCPPGKICNGPEIPVLQGQCAPTAKGSCDCVPVEPTPRATPTPQCGGPVCGGPCVIFPACPPGEGCPESELVVRKGECSADSTGACQCEPSTPTPGCATDADCDDGNPCTADRCVNGACEHGCICLTSAGEPSCCGGPSDLCVKPCGSDAAGTCGGVCPVGASCETAPTSTAACGCVSGPGGPCGGNVFAPPPVCAPGLVCHQTLPDVTGYCEKPDCVPLFTSGCSQTSDCCEPCGNGTHAPCGVCINGTCDGAP